MASTFMLVGIAFVFGFVLGLSTGLHIHPEETSSEYSNFRWVEYKKEPEE